MNTEILNRTSIAFWQMEFPSGIVNFSAKKAEMIGYDKSDFSHYTDFTELIHPEDLEIANKAMSALIRGESDFYFVEYRIKHKNGNYLWFRDQGEIIKGDDGKIIVAGYVDDISAFKNAIKEAEENKKLFRLFNDNAFDWELLQLKDHSIKFSSPACERITGYKPEDFIKNPSLLNEIVFIEDKEKWLEHRSLVTNNLESLTLRIVTKSGELRWLEHSCVKIFDDSNEFIGYRSTNRDVTIREDLKNKLLLEQQYFEFIADNTSDGILVIENGKINYASHAYKRRIGYEPNEDFNLSEAEIIENIHPEDRNNTVSAIFSAINEKKSCLLYTYRAKMKNGNYAWHEDNAKFIYDTNGNYIKAIVTSRNINDRKFKDEQILLYKKVFEQSPAPVVVTDLTGRIIISNPAFTEVSGYNEEEIIGKNVNILRSGKHDNDFYDALWEKITNGQIWKGEFFNKKKNGELYWEQASISPIVQHGNITHFVKVGLDITQYKYDQEKINQYNEELLVLSKELQDSNNILIQAKSELEKTEKYKESILNAMPDMMFIFNKKGEIIDFHASNLQQLYIEPKKFLNKNITQVLPPNLALMTMQKIDEVLKTKMICEYKYELKIKDSVYIYDARMVYIDENSTLAIVRDITILEQSNAELLSAKQKAEESSKIKTAFLQNISHEIRTPLNGIIGFSELLTDRSIDKQTAVEFSQVIKTSSDRLINTIESIIQLSELKSGSYLLQNNFFDISETLEGLFLVFGKDAKAKNIKLLNKPNNQYPIVHINSDRNAIRSILSNLIENAIKFTEKGMVEFGYDLNEKTSEIQFYVRDTGLGINSMFHDTIFNDFEQLDLTSTRGHEGMGIGLSIVKSMTEILNGKILVESEKGKGAAFLITIPVEYKKFDHNFNEINFKEEAYDNSQITVLIAEDDQLNFTYLQKLLKSWNYNTVLSTNGFDAVREALNNDKIDIILMDMNMPGIDGLESAKRIKFLKPNVKIIANTAYSNYIKKISSKYFDEVITKPINKNVLKELIRKFVDEIKIESRNDKNKR